MTFEFNPDALREYREAGLWYDEQRYGLGMEFAAAVEAAIAAILADPRRYQPSGKNTRIFRLRRFPYYIFFRHIEERQHVRVLALVHHKRRPDYWRGRS